METQPNVVFLKAKVDDNKNSRCTLTQRHGDGEAIQIFTKGKLL